MKQSILVILLALLLGGSVMSSLPVHAQSPIDGPSWTLGWATDMDSKYIVEMDLDWDADGEITAYVENNRMSPL